MKGNVVFLTCLLFFNISNAFSQGGGSDLETNLKSIDVNANADFGAFKAELGVTYNISDRKITELSTRFKMRPSDIFMTLECAFISGKAVDEVARIYKSSNGNGWGIIAKQLGIKPGSKEFHSLKAKVKAKAGNKGKGRGKPVGNKSKGKTSKSK